MTKSSDRLCPTSTAFTPRYDQEKTVKPAHQHIAIGLYSGIADPEPQYLPPLWTSFTHPEGSPYFVRNSVPKVVTGAYIYDSAVQEQVLQWVKVVDELLSSKEIKNADSMELYLEPDEENDCCRYYLVDHASRVLFWLETVETEQLGMLPTVSGDHLRSALEEVYWQHVEYFPCHEATGINLKLKELIDIFAQSQADHMTSNSSTFPYNAAQSKEFVQILKTFQESDRISAYGTWTIARLWNNVANYRTMNHHGQEVARLSRDQKIIEAPSLHSSLFYRLVSRALLKVPETYSQSLEKVWVDDIVNVHHWRHFMTNCHEEWKACLVIAFALLFTNLLFTFSPMTRGTGCLSLCILLSNMAILSSVTMLLRFRQGPTQTAHEAAAFLASVCDDHSRFQTVSIKFSLPRAMLLWAFAASTMQTLLAFLGVPQTCIIFGGVIAIIAIHKTLVVCRRGLLRLLSGFRRLVHSRQNVPPMDAELPGSCMV